MMVFVGNIYDVRMALAATANSSIGNKISYYPTYTTPSHTIFNTAMNIKTAASYRHGVSSLEKYTASVVKVNE
jgi:hypothetical protein